MKDRFKVDTKKWLVISGLLLLMSITSVGFVQAVDLTDTEKSWLTLHARGRKAGKRCLHFYV